MNAIWKDIIVTTEFTIREAIEKIDHSAMQCVLVVDQNQRLKGMITDGDLRRGILKGFSLEKKATSIMKANPITAPQSTEEEKLLSLMRKRKIHHLPIVDEQGRLVDLKILSHFFERKPKKNWVIIMAGGIGSRLRPLTNERPKPLIKLGDVPILEIIIKKLKEYGFEQIYLTVNYKAEMIKEYFKDGHQWGVHINYINENQRLGTAGALSLLPSIPSDPVLVMNSDLLTNLNFERLLEFHRKNQGKATLCVRQFEFQVPYGVVNVNNNQLNGLEEKPIQYFFVNAGIYVLDPSILMEVPKNTFYDMTTLFRKLVDQQQNIYVFPIREYWLDIGKLDDLERAKKDYLEFFL